MNDNLKTSNLPINVVLDVSTLGSSYRFAQKAGIFRFSYDFSRTLVDSPECNLSFCSSESLELLFWTKRFLESEDILSKYPFIAHQSLQVNWKNKQEYYKNINRLIEQIHRLGFTKTKTIKEKLINLACPSSSLLDLDALKRQNIYHSLYYAIPSELKNLKLKKFVTIYDLIPVLYPQFFIKAVREQFLQMLGSLDSDTWAICISESTKRDLCSYRPDLDPEKIFVAYPGSADFFHPGSDPQRISQVKQKYNIPDEPYVLSLSTLEIRKNIAHLIRGFLNLINQEKVEDLHLVLAGKKGWLDSEIYRDIEDLAPDLRKRIIFTGYIANEDLAPLYSGALVFVYLSLYEGFGLPPLEAMKCGTPVITSNTSSLPEVIGDAGLTIDPQDEDSLCSSIWKVYRHPALRDRLSTQSIQQAAQFSWSRCTQQTISAYKYALNF